MSYPMKEVNEFGNSYYKEMTPTEYLSRITLYAEQMIMYSKSKYRRDREYASYLKAWFSNSVCDGYTNFDERFKLHKEPMPYNIYFC